VRRQNEHGIASGNNHVRITRKQEKGLQKAFGAEEMRSFLNSIKGLCTEFIIRQVSGNGTYSK